LQDCRESERDGERETNGENGRRENMEKKCGQKQRMREKGAGDKR